jgi:hypothetical protein
MRPQYELIAASLLLAVGAAPAAATEVQTDWSGGPGVFGPVSAFGETFLAADGVSWRSIEGQLALSSLPLEPAVETVIDQYWGVRGVAAVDINGDGRTDIVSADPLTDIFEDLGATYWWEQTEGGTWIRHTIDDVLEGGQYVDGADVDGDGDMDVILAAYFGSGLHHDPPPPDLPEDGHYVWFENLAGDGSSWETHIVAHRYNGARWIEAGDVDGDGDIDLVGASELTDGFWEADGDIVFLENLDGAGDSWEIHELATDYASAFNARLGDLDGDGDLDIVGTDYDRILWYENIAGDGSEWLERFVETLLLGAAYAAVGDVDDDGDLDIVGGASSTSTVACFENTAGDGSVWLPHGIVGATHGRNVRLADMNGDGHLDVLLDYGFGPENLYWIEQVPGAPWAPHAVAPNLEGDLMIAAGDVNNDGRLDIAVSDQAYDTNGPGLKWYDVTTFADTGDLLSSVLDGGANPEWSVMNWTTQIPGGTTFGVQVRASNDPFNLGPFIDVPVSGTDLGDLLDPDAEYFQYRLLLDSADGAASPIVRDISVDVGVGLTGDLNGDGSVDVTDLLELLAAWGPCPDPPADCPADLNGDGTVGVIDLLMLLGNWT